MPDNFTILDSVGTTQTIATRDVGGAHYQNVAPVVTTAHRITTGSTNAVSVKAAAGTLRGAYIFNAAAYPVYLKFHNTAGTPTAGSGVVFTIAAQAGIGTLLIVPGGGRSFATGIAYTMVKDIADAGTTPVLANDALIEVFYD